LTVSYRIVQSKQTWFWREFWRTGGTWSWFSHIIYAPRTTQNVLQFVINNCQKLLQKCKTGSQSL